ncbi:MULTISPECIES: metallopeptidase family protein [unclassified Streptomyces]|uniref:metallopeptidase family protein n=1 Tax=Streptomyces sp. NPDC127129 TaxID=3345373 RepID=UPI003637D82B
MDSPVPPRPSSRPAQSQAGDSRSPETRPSETRPEPPEPRTRRRDRHGRGMRGPVAPPQVPLSASRADTFRDLVLDSVERLERRWPQLADVEFLVLDVPPTVSGESVPLGGSAPAAKGGPARVVVYRRPVEIRSKSRDERALLVHEVVVEQVAELLGLSPESVDPRYGQD